MKQASSRELFGYWAVRRGKRAAPERGEIEPSAIRRALGDVFILEFDRRTSRGPRGTHPVKARTGHGTTASVGTSVQVVAHSGLRPATGALSGGKRNKLSTLGSTRPTRAMVWKVNRSVGIS